MATYVALTALGMFKKLWKRSHSSLKEWVRVLASETSNGGVLKVCHLRQLSFPIVQEEGGKGVLVAQASSERSLEQLHSAAKYAAAQEGHALTARVAPMTILTVSAPRIAEVWAWCRIHSLEAAPIAPSACL